MTARPSPTFPLRRLLVPLAVAFAARVAVGHALPAGRGGVRGFDFYGYMADNLLEGHGLSWLFYEGLGVKLANRAPLYPLMIAGVRGVFGSPATLPLLLVQSAVGAAAILLPAAFALRWAGTRGAVLAAWFAALWPYSVVADTGMVEHVVYAPLCLLAAWTTIRAQDAGDRPARRALDAGAAIGFAALARITFVVSAPFLALAVVRRIGIARTALVAVGAAAVLTPWVLRNHAVVGHYVLGTDGGRALLIGNSPHTFTRYPALSIDEGERAVFRAMDAEQPEVTQSVRRLAHDEVAQDRRFHEIARGVLAADPAGAAWRWLRKAAAQWSVIYNPGPVSPLKLALFAATFGPLLVAAAAAVATSARLRADLPVVLALAASFTLVAAVFWGQPRYLAPLHGLGLAAAAAWLARRPEDARPAA